MRIVFIHYKSLLALQVAASIDNHYGEFVNHLPAAQLYFSLHTRIHSELKATAFLTLFNLLSCWNCKQVFNRVNFLTWLEYILYWLIRSKGWLQNKSTPKCIQDCLEDLSLRINPASIAYLELLHFQVCLPYTREHTLLLTPQLIDFILNMLLFSPNSSSSIWSGALRVGATHSDTLVVSPWSGSSSHIRLCLFLVMPKCCCLIHRDIW